MKTRSLKLSALFFVAAIILPGCDPTDDQGAVDLPLLTTNPITQITQNTAKSGGSISIENNVDILVSGVCWSLHRNPTTNDSITTDETANGSYTNTLRNLIPDTTYYVRAYATCKNGVGYGQEVSFKTLEASTPTINTIAPTIVYNTSLTVSANYSNQGGLPILSKGFCWSKSNNPTLTDSVVESTGLAFSSNINNLKSGDTYYIRAYATNAKGTGFGNAVTVTTKITDVEGHTYHCVKIGTQTWMVENLKTGKYRNGKAIPFVNNDTWVDLTTAAYNTNYGYKYNWYAVKDSANKLAPEGWHIPTIQEWNTLLSFIGGKSVAGSKLKETGTANWPSPNSDATNEYGFTATPQGWFGFFNYNVSTTAMWWTQSEDPDKQYTWFEEPAIDGCSWYIEINSSRPDALTSSTDKYLGLSVRCIRDN